MIQRLEQELLKQGYLFQPVQLDSIRVYYQVYEHKTRVIISIDCTGEYIISRQQLDRFKETLERRYEQPEIFTILWLQNVDRGEELSYQNPNSWMVDLFERKLIIYENQPGDFYGLRGLLEQLLRNPVPEQIEKKQELKSVGIVTIALVGINILVFLWLEWKGNTTSSEFMLQHGAMYPEKIISGHEFYRFFTEMFLHFGVEHLFNNMLVLFFLGSSLERAIGRGKYLLIYVLAGLCGSGLSLWMMVQSGNWAVAGGASGAIFGVVGALLYVVIRNKGRLEDLTTGRLVFMVLLTLYLGYTTTGVDNMAHLGGLVSGAILGLAFYRKKG